MCLELKSCEKVEVAVLGSPPLIVLMVSVDIKKHLKQISHASISKHRFTTVFFQGGRVPERESWNVVILLLSSLPTTTSYEPVWPSGKALGWLAEGSRLDSAPFSSKRSRRLWTLSCDFVQHFLLKH